jgi:hypothetical protein
MIFQSNHFLLHIEGEGGGEDQSYEETVAYVIF